MSKVCNGEVDCLHGDDESGCIALVDPSTLARRAIRSKSEGQGSINSDHDIGEHFNAEGILFIRHHGRWGPLCFDSFEHQDQEHNSGHPQSSNEINQKDHSTTKNALQVSDMGEAVCKANYYHQLSSIDVVPLPARFSQHLLYHSISANLSTELRPSLSM